MISIILPAYNEQEVLGETLDAVQRLKGRFEVFVADGGSRDRTVEIARRRGVVVVEEGRGRGAQMRAAAAHASGDVLWFLHADTLPPPDALALIEKAFGDPAVVAGNFHLRFNGSSPGTRFLSWAHSLFPGHRMSFGDTAIFIRRTVYDEIGGFRPYSLFEDLDLIARVLKRGRFVRVQASVTTSARRIEKRRFWPTFLRWSVLLVLYRLGVHPERLSRYYAAVR